MLRTEQIHTYMVNEFQQKYKVIQGGRINFVTNDAENLISIYKNKKKRNKKTQLMHMQT